MAEHGGLLLVHAHPDDEAMTTGGLIAMAVDAGRRVDLVTCTDGAEGEIHDPSLDIEEARPRLAQIRRDELDCSLDALGGGKINLHLLGYRDSGMMGTDANAHPDAFWQSDLEGATERLVRIVREARPAVMVGYDENGGYGHPDHINAHRIAFAAFDAAADPGRFPHAGAPHEVAKLYQTAFPRERWFGLMMAMKERGISLPWDFDETVETYAADQLNPSNAEAVRQAGEQLETGEGAGDFGTPEAAITTRIDVSAVADRKRACMACHRTQAQDLGWLLALPDDLAAAALSPESLILRRWRGHEPLPDGLDEDDLFAGLDA
jgi:N-acetyl-1-D-myo-inositol-2-amino-2-deoxy-alpha-D-glucopyranoside deacetylase